MTPGRPAVPYRRLAWLAAAVLGAHLVLLRATPHALTPATQPAPLRGLVTRSIEPGAGTPAPGASVAPAADAVPAATKAVTRKAPTVIAAARATTRAAPADMAQPPAEPAASGFLVSTAAAQPAPVPAPASAPAPEAAAAAARQSNSADRRLHVPGSAVINYSVSAEAKGLPYSAGATLSWHHDGQSYAALLEVHTLLGSRVQTSRGQLGPAGLEPERFSDKVRSEQATHFERAKGIISFSNNSPSTPLMPGAQDRLSVMLQLGALIAGEPARHPVGSTIEVPTAGLRDSETWAFTIEALETLKLPGGEVEALRLTRQRRQEYDQRVELWLAPSLDYLPVRVRIVQANGDFVDQRWRSTDKP